MKAFLSRAMQIALLEKKQLEDLHRLETRSRYAIPNWNIQSLFYLPTIKEKCGIPNDDEAQARHSERIEKELFEKNFLRRDERHGCDVESYHEFDWIVFNRRNEIVWDYSGPQARSGMLKALGKRRKVALKAGGSEETTGT